MIYDRNIWHIGLSRAFLGQARIYAQWTSMKRCRSVLQRGCFRLFVFALKWSVRPRVRAFYLIIRGGVVLRSAMRCDVRRPSSLRTRYPTSRSSFSSQPPRSYSALTPPPATVHPILALTSNPNSNHWLLTVTVTVTSWRRDKQTYTDRLLYVDHQSWRW